MQHRIHTIGMFGIVALAASLAACSGKGSDDTLADGAVDRPTSNNGSTGVGPGAPPVQSATPAAGNSAAQPAATPPGGATGAATLTLATQGAHGPHIADAAGNALYYVEGDRDGTRCVGPCLQSWPPVTVTDQQPTGAAGIQGAMIATIMRPEGTRQVTFEGHPLYRYAADAGAGQANGDGIKDKFGTWRLVSPSPVAGAAGAGTQPPTGAGSTGG